MGLAEELSRLAELKDKGVLTQKEFDRKKKQLLNGGKSGSSKFMTAVAGLVAFMIIGGVALRAVEHFGQKELACDAPEVQQVVLNAVNQEIDGIRSNFGLLGSHMVPPGTQAHDMSEIIQIHRDEKTGFIACAATTRIGQEQGDVGYTVSWIDRVGGEFWVKLVHHKELGDRYRKQ